MRLDYLRDPEEIYRRSFAAVRAEADLAGLPEDIAALAVRLVHACGMPEIVADLAWDGDPVAAGRAALGAGGAVMTDSAMVASGVSRRRLGADTTVSCMLDDEAVPARAAQLGTTRSAAAIDLRAPALGGAVVAIGNAPTALFRLIERLGEGVARPAVILAFPVGFIGAVESKQALIDANLGVPYLTLRGRRGGSALAAAAVNALAGAPAGALAGKEG